MTIKEIIEFLAQSGEVSAVYANGEKVDLIESSANNTADSINNIDFKKANLNTKIKCIESPNLADFSALSFLEKEEYLNAILSTKAAAILMRPKDYEKNQENLPPQAVFLLCASPYLAMAYLTKFFQKPLYNSNLEPPQIAPSAQIAKSAKIGAGSKIGENCIITDGVVIGENCEIGAECVIFPNVVLYNDTKIANRVRIGANSVIGSDGFGYAHTELGEHIKIYHNGCVKIEDDVEIGSNTSIDRAVFGQTIIKRGVKIDNLVQIGHNCEIGEFSIIVSQVGLAGSTTTGRNVVLGGQAGAAGHLHIGDFAQIGAKGAIAKDVPAHGVYSGHPLLPLREWLKLQALWRRMLKSGK